MSVGGFGFLSQPVAAKSQAEPYAYTVKPILPDNQTDSQATFYNLQVQPQQKQTLKLLISNIGTKKIVVHVAVNDSYTSDNGIIGYDHAQVTPYRPQNPQLSSLIVGKRTGKVILNPKASDIYQFTYQAPAKPIKGLILGGVTTVATAGSSNAEQLSIQNRIRYVNGIVLRSNHDPVTPQVTMSKQVTGKVRTMQKGVGFKLFNSAPINIGSIQLQAHFTLPSGKHKTVKLNNLQMAPSSTWNAFIPMEKLAAGNYTLKLNFTARNHYSKVFIRHFTISKAQRKHLIREQQPKRYNNVWVWIILIGILALVFVGLYYLLIYLKGRNQKSKR